MRAQPRGMEPARELPQLLGGEHRLLAGAGDQARRLRGRRLDGAQREVEALAEHHEPLLRAVVQVAPDPAALLVGRVQDPRARRGDLRLAGAQRRLVPAPLELRGRARGEDAQDGELLLARVQPRTGEHADVADQPPLRAVHGHGEVALEPLPTVAGTAGARSLCRRLSSTTYRRARTRRPPRACRRPASTRAPGRGSAGRRAARRRRPRQRRRRRRGSARASAGRRRRRCRGARGDRAQQVALVALGEVWRGGGGHGVRAAQAVRILVPRPAPA